MGYTSQPLVSIVTPVYNGAEYLSECIESVLAQTYQNWNYTIVNNCSTDGSKDIAQHYAARDARIRVVDNADFLPVIANHNAALRQISPDSKYCKLVFGDDWIFPECIERMVSVAEEWPSVGIVGAHVLEGREVKCQGLPYQSVMFDGREICRQHFRNRLYVFESANAVLYRSDLVRNKPGFYNEKNIHADTESCFALLRSNDFGFVHQILTYTRLRPESLKASSADFQTHLAGTLHVLCTYGQHYLSPTDLARILKNHLSEYYRFLGKCFLRGDHKILNHHKEKLLEAGVRFRWSRVVLGALSTTAGLAMKPKFVAERLVNAQSQVNASRSTKGEWSGSIVPDAIDGHQSK
jgi:glycosyltransferase involved in cell wall biosynthesis